MHGAPRHSADEGVTVQYGALAAPSLRFEITSHFCNRPPQGNGVYVFASGQKYEGAWAKGKKHGWSIYTVETGALARGRRRKGPCMECVHTL